MTVAPTLEQQLDALIAEQRLSSISLGRNVMNDGTHIWDISAHGDGYCGMNRGLCDGSVEAELRAALADLNRKRAPAAPVVPELAPLEQAA